MYEIKKYLEIDPYTLDVKKALSVDKYDFPLGKGKSQFKAGPRPYEVYRVSHFKPFELTDENILEFIEILFQGYVNIENFKFGGKSFSRTEGIIKREASAIINKISFKFEFEAKFIVISSGEKYDFSEIIPLINNQNNFNTLKRIKRFIDKMDEWIFLRDKLKSKLKKQFGYEFSIQGYIERLDSGKESGSFTLILHKDLMEKTSIRKVEFLLMNKELTLTTSRKDNSKSMANKFSPQFYRERARQLNMVADNLEEIESVVRWVIFSSRREERLKEILDKI